MGTRSSVRAPVVGALLALSLSACGLNGGSDEQAPDVPSGSVALNGAPDPESPAPAPVEEPSAERPETASSQTEDLARTAVTDYFTWSYRDPDWQTWVSRLTPYGTEGFEHSLSELFTEGSDGSWEELVVAPRLESRVEVVSLSPSKFFEATDREVRYLAKINREIRTDGGPWEQTTLDAQEIVVVKQGDRWLVEDVRVDPEALDEDYTAQ